jgi:hypothetical protein
MADTNLIYPYEFEGGKKAVASEVNANFEAVKAFSNGVNATLTDIKTALEDLKNKPTREMFDVYYSFSAETPIGAYPLWTGETITNCKSLYPQFWKKLNSLVEKAKVPSVTAEEYEEKLETYGQCASFYVDTLNGHVRLPKITRFISSIADLTELAELENDTLKKHKHDVNVSSSGGKEGYDTSTGYLARGYTKYSSPWSKDTNGINEVLITEVGEDETHPKNVKLCLYLQVANNISEISELDIDVIITQMNEALTALDTAFNNYYNQLTELYSKIKEDIIESSPTIKEGEIVVTPDMFYEDATYEEYPFAVDVNVPDATENAVPTVNFGLEQTQSGNFAPIAYSGNGFVRIYAKAVSESEFVIPSIVLQ